MTQVSEQTNGVLLQWLANAAVTSATALGHSKSQQNQLKVNAYKQELCSRKVPIPTDDELYEKGIFNGEGSY